MVLWIVDIATNTFNTLNNTLTVDTTPPNIILVYPDGNEITDNVR
jgi:hypothetical protein